MDTKIKNNFSIKKKIIIKNIKKKTFFFYLFSDFIKLPICVTLNKKTKKKYN